MTRTVSRTVSALTAALLSLATLQGMTLPRARAFGTPSTRPASANTRGPERGLNKSLTKLPSVFEENAGQFGGRARFVSRGAGHTLALGAEGVTLALLEGGGKEGSGGASRRAA